MTKLKCVCGLCDDEFRMDREMSNAEFNNDLPVRGISIHDTDLENIVNLVIPESLAQVIEKWIKENNDKE